MVGEWTIVRLALTRGVSPAIADCELTYLARAPIDYQRALAQHRAYLARLEELGLRNCCFVEDAAIVLDEVAVITRMGAPTRRGETPAVAEALARYRPLVRLQEPARIDGGDVLVLGRRLFVGLSPRTDAAGVEALAAAVRPLGYDVVPVRMTGCLHLKTAVTAAGPHLLVINPEWVDGEAFRGLETIEVAEDEPWAANVLAVGEAVVVAAGFPRTAERLRSRGLDVHALDVSEFLKAEAGVTCKSVIFDVVEDAPVE
jgi:dimethylargininase